MSTPLNRVETLLQNSDKALYIHQIVALADVGEKEAKTSIKTLHDMGQIETIQTPGRWGNRYAWLAAKPVISEPAVIAEADQVAGVQATVTGDGSGEALPDVRDVQAVAAAPEISQQWPWTEDGPELINVNVPTVAAGVAHASLRRYMTTTTSRLPEQTRYAVAVPKRPLRIVKSLARAEALALSAVRRGAKGAEVFALMPVGHAKQEAVFQGAIA